MKILSLPVGQIKKQIKSLPASESSLVAEILRAIEKKKTYEYLNKLDRKGEITRNLTNYLPWQDASTEQLQQAITTKKETLTLFELLTVSHLYYSGTGKERSFDFQKYFKLSASPNEISMPEPEISDKNWFISVLERCKSERAVMTNEEFAETLLVPAGKYKHSLYKHSRTPYNRQIHKWMSPENNCVSVTNMWGVQIGKSTALENTATYYSKIVPSDIMLAVADGGAAEKVSKMRYYPRAALAGVKFVAENYGDAKMRSTGNKILFKEFIGGSISFVSVNSPSQTASTSIRVSLNDELDRWAKKQSRGDEGSPFAGIRARTDAYGERKKELNVSSPNLMHSSLIYQLFLQGTQHHYHIPCPICGHEHPLEMGYDREHGLAYELKNNKVDPSKVYYVCPNGGENPNEKDKHWQAKNPNKHRWFETHKMVAMQKGDWVAHAEPEIPNHVSTQLSSLYSPFLSWVAIAYKHRATVLNPEIEQEFVNMVLGLPYELKGTRPDMSKMNVLRDQSYGLKEVPEGVLYLTAAIDVQRGSTGERRAKNPPRLELQILGICNNFSAKVIDYQQIMGDTDIPDKGAWKTLNDMMASGKFKYPRHRDGLVFEPRIWLFDSRDGSRTDTVYKYCLYYGGARMFPSMGEKYIYKDYRTDSSEDHATTKSYLPYKARKVDNELTVYHISTTHYKKNIYHNLESTLAKAGELGDFVGKLYFPRDIEDSYFDMLTAEEMRSEGNHLSFYCPSGRRNEALDTFVYCLAGSDIWMNMYRDSLRTYAKGKGQKDTTYIDYAFCKDTLAVKTGQVWADEEFKKRLDHIAKRL